MKTELKIDFLKGTIAHRKKYGGGKKQLLAKACGVGKYRHLSVLDATAGLGKDAYILASLGCKVLLLERNASVFLALLEAIQRAQRLGDRASFGMKVMHQDSRTYLSALRPHDYPKVIYLDPMYPVMTKSALPKKSMLILRSLVGADEDAADLLKLALEKALYRVVVKRPYYAPFLAECSPNFRYLGKSSRFDVYLSHQIKRGNHAK